MSNEILIALIAGSVLHASWNIAGRAYREHPGFLWSVILWSVIWAWLLVPFVFAQIPWSRDLFFYAVISALGLSVYYKFVRISYSCGDISQVYPVIRSSPIWVALVSVLFLGESLSFFAWFGLFTVVSGILIIPQKSLHPIRLLKTIVTLNEAIRYALIASMGTCIYSLSDKEIMTQLNSPASAIGFLLVSSTLGMFFWFLIDRPALKGFLWKKISIQTCSLWKTCLLGLSAFLAYFIATATMIYAPASKVLALTNMSLIFGTLAGIILFQERDNIPNRIAGLSLIIVGVSLLKYF